MRPSHAFSFYAAVLFAITSQVVDAQPSATPSPAPGPGPGTPAPRIQFAETVHDFGIVNVGEVLSCTFLFTNTGNSVLEVTEVRPGCGCTAAGEWDRQVQPGKTGRVPLQVNTAGFHGPVVKTPMVLCNDPTQPNIVLQLKADIRRPVEFVPNMVVFYLNADSVTNEVRIVNLTNNLADAIEFSAPEVSNPAAFRAELKTVRAGREFELAVFAQGPLNPGTVQAAINLKGRTNNLILASIPVISVVQPAVMVIPAMVYLPPGPLSNPAPVTIFVQNNSSAAMSISNATVNLDQVQARVVETRPGHQFQVTLTFPPGFEIPAGQKVSLTIQTSHPRHPEISVPIMQPPRPTPPAPPPTPQAIAPVMLRPPLIPAAPAAGPPIPDAPAAEGSTPLQRR